MEYTDEFEGFWNVYPRKVSKLPAFKAFSKLDPDSQQAARVDVEKRNRAHWWSSDPRKIPHAATYLNAARWEDEWEADLVARREAQPTAGIDPHNYKPRDTGTPMSKWKALANRVALKWLRTTGGFSYETEHENEMLGKAFAEELSVVVRDGENYFEEDYFSAMQNNDLRGQRQAVLSFTELLLSRLDKRFNKNVAQSMMRRAKGEVHE